MDAKFSELLLNILIENSSRILGAHFGVDRAEATFFQIVELLQEEPAAKVLFLAKAEAVLRDLGASRRTHEIMPTELLELVAHETRWPELVQLAEERRDRLRSGSVDLSVSDVCRTMLDAQREDWADRSFYRRYRKNEG